MTYPLNSQSLWLHWLSFLVWCSICHVYQMSLLEKWSRECHQPIYFHWNKFTCIIVFNFLCVYRMRNNDSIYWYFKFHVLNMVIICGCVCVCADVYISVQNKNEEISIYEMSRSCSYICLWDMCCITWVLCHEKRSNWLCSIFSSHLSHLLDPHLCEFLSSQHLTVKFSEWIHNICQWQSFINIDLKNLYVNIDSTHFMKISNGLFPVTFLFSKTSWLVVIQYTL